jgi:aquaporin Z
LDDREGNIESMPLFAKLVAEFIGTFALCYVGIAAICNDVGLIGIALAHGLTIAVFASALIPVSGGQFNPAVTIALLASGHMKPGESAAYIVAQCLAGFAGVGALLATLDPSVLAATHYGTPFFPEMVSIPGAIVMEIILTFILMFVIYGVAVGKTEPRLAGAHIGLTVTLAILAGGPITGAAMNPARQLGPAVMSGEAMLIGQIWLYWLAPIVGAVLAALLFKHCLLEENKQ